MARSSVKNALSADAISVLASSWLLMSFLQPHFKGSCGAVIGANPGRHSHSVGHSPMRHVLAWYTPSNALQTMGQCAGRSQSKPVTFAGQLQVNCWKTSSNPHVAPEPQGQNRHFLLGPELVSTLRCKTQGGAQWRRGRL